MQKKPYQPSVRKQRAGLAIGLTMGLLTLAAGSSGARRGPQSKGSKPVPQNTQSPHQRMIVPSYFGPGPLWSKMEGAVPRVGLVAILNPNSGPGDAAQADFVAQVKATRARGAAVLGYVHTSYGKRPLAEVQTEIERYYKWYKVSGIFLDEVSNDDHGLPYYLRCRRVVRDADPKAFVIINPGTQVTEGYLKTADVVVTFESDYGTYVKRAADPAWVRRYPANRFWHLVYGAPDMDALQTTIRLSKQRNAGWVYVTPDTLPNPWDTLPDEAYWSAELAAMAGGKNR